MVKRTTIDLDLDELDAARAVLGTTTARETVHVALRQVIRRAKLARAAEAIRSGKYASDIVTPEELAELRRVRS
jgi:Arc/MetJ family transcription regulator